MKKVIALVALLGVAVFAQQKGSFTDPRDKKTYKTVKIGTQTWMAENLNYAEKDSRCFDNKPANCQKYGRLYDWETAMKACPKDWHLPSDKEWQTLVDIAGGKEAAGKKLKAKNGWNKKGNGTDDYGFSALPGGYDDEEAGPVNAGINGVWWSAIKGDDDYVYSLSMIYSDGSSTLGNYDYYKSTLNSVRCVKDFEDTESNDVNTSSADLSSKTSVSTQDKPEKLAVYVSGASDAGVNKSFRNNLLATIVQSGKYAEIGDTETFYKELEKNREEGISQITKTAKKHGADIVCVVSMTEAFGEYSISARTVKASDSQIIKTVSLNRSLKSLDDLTRASNELVKQLFQQQQPQQPAAAGSDVSLFNPSASAQPYTAAEASTEKPYEPPAASASSDEGSAQPSGNCYEEFADAPEKLDNFDIPSYIANLAIVKGKCSVPVLGGFLCSPEVVGLSAKCVKELPTNLGELQKFIIGMAPVMIKGFIAKQLGISRDRIPSDVSQLKDFAIEIGTEKAAEALGINPSEVPKNIKGMENFVYSKVEKKASEALGVEKSAIPKDKAQLSPFIQEQAKKKIASKLGMKADEVKLSASALKGYAEKDRSLAPVAGLVQAANIWGILSLVSTACPLLKCPGDDTNISDDGAAFTMQPDDDDDIDYYDEDDDEKPAKKPKSGETRFGARLAYNGSMLRIEGEDGLLGHGVEFGGVANIPLAGNLAFNLGLNAIYRTPYNETYSYGSWQYSETITIKIYEYVLSVPALLRYGFLDDLIYAEAGFQADIPLKTEIQRTISSSEPEDDGTFYYEYDTRKSLDFSVVLGLGLNISENFGIGIRGIYGLTEFDEDPESVKLIQGGIGLTYLF